MKKPSQSRGVEESDANQSKTEQANAPPHGDASRSVCRALRSADPQASAEEQLLQELLAETVANHRKLSVATGKLSERLLGDLADARASYATSRVLHEVVKVSTALNKRSQALTGALLSMRAQRRMLEAARSPGNGV